jgi:hypothetical protein
VSPVHTPPARHRQPRIDTAAPLLCHYAGDPARRPGATLTAEVLTGQIALCRPCAQARSTLGKGTPPLPLPPGPAFDVLDWITQADTAVRQAQRHLTTTVTRARQNGHSWAQIAGRLGVTRQAAQQRFGDDPSLKG